MTIFESILHFSRLAVVFLLHSIVHPEDPFAVYRYPVFGIMGKSRKGRKKVGEEVSKSELGKTKQNVQRLDLASELKDVQTSADPVTKQMSKLKMPSKIKLDPTVEEFKPRKTRSSTEIAVASPSGTEVSSFMKTFLNTKLEKTASKKNKKSCAKSSESREKSESSFKDVFKSGGLESDTLTMSTSDKKKRRNSKSKLEKAAKKSKSESTVSKKQTPEQDNVSKDWATASTEQEIMTAETGLPESSMPCTSMDPENFYIHHYDENFLPLTSSKQQYSTFSTILIPDSNIVILLMETDDQCALKGKYQLSSLKGTAEIYGFKVSPKTGWQSVYSADNNSHLVIRARYDAKESVSQLSQARQFLKENGHEQHIAAVTEKTCVFLLRELYDPMCNTVTSMQPFKKLFTIPYASLESHLSMIGASEVESYDRILRIGDQFLQLGKHFRHAVKEARSQKTRAPSLVLVGGVNTGKSTLCRFMVNSLLHCSDEVIYLECDIGQTELTPPGCISLSCVRRPLLGPPFSHLQANQIGDVNPGSSGPVLQYYYGHVTPSDDPARYIECLQQTIQHYHSNYSHLPLIVNTMGWNQGLGLLLMLDTLKMVRPSFIAQIKSSNEHRNYPTLSPQYVRQNKGWKQGLKAPNDLDYKRFNIDSVVSQTDVHRSYAPADHRDLALLAYLCGRPQNPFSCYADLFGMIPYVLPWSAVGVCVVHTTVPYQHIMYALNASVVGLCTVPSHFLQNPEDPTLPKMIPHVPVSPCHMFGIVRAIDPEQRVFHITTPEPPERLVGVNALIVGGVKTPRQLMLRESGMGHLPYVDSPQMVQGMPRKRCPQRPGLKNRK